MFRGRADESGTQRIECVEVGACGLADVDKPLDRPVWGLPLASGLSRGMVGVLT